MTGKDNMLEKSITVADDGRYVSSIAIIDNDVFLIRTEFPAFRPNGRKAKKRMKKESCFTRSNHDGSYTVGMQCIINAKTLAAMLSFLRKSDNGELYFAKDNE